MKTISILLTVAAIVMSIVLGVTMYNCYVDCIGHLKRAADSNTKELAQKELKVVLDYLDRRDLKSGNTGFIFHTPANDLDFFYSNIKSTYEELVALPEESTPLEKSNMLMKARETILDGTEVTHPSNISIYPSLALWKVLFPILWILTVCSWIGCVAYYGN